MNLALADAQRQLDDLAAELNTRLDKHSDGRHHLSIRPCCLLAEFVLIGIPPIKTGDNFLRRCLVLIDERASRVMNGSPGEPA
jgi:hypothetical protein